MESSDSLQRFLFENSAIRGEIVQLDASWNAVREKHDYPHPLQQVLGELTAASALLAATLKFTGSLTLQLQGDGPVSLIVVECTSERTVRAIAKWCGELEPRPLRELLGDGRLVITIDPRGGKERYQGIVTLEGDTVAAALQDYLVRSEQLDSQLWLAADDRRATGMLLQKLPGQTADDPDAWQRVVQLGSTIRREELLGLPAMSIIRRLYHEEDVRVFERDVYSFRCSCSRDRVVGVLRLMGVADVRELLEEEGTVKVNCEFCNHRYEFDAVDVEQIFAAPVIAHGRSTRH